MVTHQLQVERRTARCEQRTGVDASCALADQPEAIQSVNPDQQEQAATDRPIMSQRGVSRVSSVKVRVRISISDTLGLVLVSLARICG